MKFFTHLSSGGEDSTQSVLQRKRHCVLSAEYILTEYIMYTLSWVYILSWVYTLSSHCRKPSGPRSLPPNHQDWNEIQGIRSSKMHLGCNPLGTLNIHTKNLKPGSRDRQQNVVRSHTPFCCLFLQQTHKITPWTSCRQQLIYASCPTWHTYFINLSDITQIYAWWFSSGNPKTAWSHFHHSGVTADPRSLCCSLWSVTAQSLRDLLDPPW